MSQEKIKYKRPVEEKAGGVYSCDKVQLVYRLRFGEGQERLDQMARQGWFEYDHWESRKFGTYRNQFSVKCGADGKLSYWLGVGMVAYGKSRPSDTAKLEFNPNKVGDERSLLWLLRQLWSRAKLREGCEVKQWDLACDWPEPREWYSLRKDARLYEEVMRSKADRTQYLGERNKPGRCKLYNKQAESGLASPLSACLLYSLQRPGLFLSPRYCVLSALLLITSSYSRASLRRLYHSRGSGQSQAKSHCFTSQPSRNLARLHSWRSSHSNDRSSPTLFGLNSNLAVSLGLLLP